MNLSVAGADRESGAVRGIHALSLSAFVGEKPAALEFWRAVSSVIQLKRRNAARPGDRRRNAWSQATAMTGD